MQNISQNKQITTHFINKQKKKKAVLETFFQSDIFVEEPEDQE